MERLAGIPASPGRIRGPVWSPPDGDGRGRRPEASATGSAPNDGAVAEERLRGAARAARNRLVALAARSREAGRPDEAEILEAQALMAVDPTLTAGALRRIREGLEPAAAVEEAAEEAAERLEELADTFLSARATDVRDVGARIGRILAGADAVLPAVPSIAAGRDLPPSLIAEIDAGLLLGIVLEEGSPTAHAAIVARSMQIPMVVGAHGLVRALAAASASGASLAADLDGSQGAVILGSPGEIDAVTPHPVVPRVVRDHLHGPLRTSRGEPIRLLANIVPGEEARAIEAGAEGVGLLRTEFLFLGRSEPPGEEEQLESYRRTFEAFGPDRPVAVRLADVGGDKEVPYLDIPLEANPFLGVRGIRIAYRRPAFVTTQLRAIARAAGEAGIVPRVLAPMVATVDDVELFRRLCEEALAGLAREGLSHAERFVIGAMIEVPAAALLASAIAERVDFLSIGTNDLTQYTLAADRGNALLAGLQDPLHPAVLRLIAGVVEAAAAASVEVEACGEAAGDPEGALVLAALGIRELSADAGSLDAVRHALSGWAPEVLDALAAEALAASSPGPVRAAARRLLASPRRRPDGVAGKS